jgi:L-rhamnose-H+ transport protein
LATIPAFGGVLAGAGGVVLAVAVCGAAWGVAQVLFGLALEKIGISLTFSIVLGLSAAMGGLVPLVRLHRDKLLTRSGLLSLAGIALVLLGVAVSAAAGRMRDRSQHTAARTGNFGVGLLMAIASGVCASMMNVGFSLGIPLSAAAASHHANALWWTDAIWVPLLAGGAVPNLLYCAYLLRKRKSSENYRVATAGRNVLLAVTMAVLWFGSSVLYGIATAFLGDLGLVVGWPLFMSLIVIVASVLGIWTGEWRDAEPRALRVQGLAVLLLVCAVVMLSRAAS